MSVKLPRQFQMPKPLKVIGPKGNQILPQMEASKEELVNSESYRGKNHMPCNHCSTQYFSELTELSLDAANLEM